MTTLTPKWSQALLADLDQDDGRSTFLAFIRDAYRIGLVSAINNDDGDTDGPVFSIHPLISRFLQRRHGA